MGFSSEGFTSLAIEKYIQDPGPGRQLAVCWRHLGSWRRALCLVEPVSSGQVRVRGGPVVGVDEQAGWVLSAHLWLHGFRVFDQHLEA